MARRFAALLFFNFVAIGCVSQGQLIDLEERISIRIITAERDAARAEVERIKADRALEDAIKNNTGDIGGMKRAIENIDNRIAELRKSISEMKELHGQVKEEIGQSKKEREEDSEKKRKLIARWKEIEDKYRLGDTSP